MSSVQHPIVSRRPRPMAADAAIRVPKTWAQPLDHYLKALDSPWYRLVFGVLDTVHSETVLHMKRRGLRGALLPLTTHSISSPMGLGSDSLPVKVDLFGVDTYLADSMQFMLEYGCRLSEKGCCYVMPSFRGEECDERHLSQFFHSEAEIPGDLDDVIRFVESYTKALAAAILREHTAQLAPHFDLRHLYDLVSTREGFPRVSLDEAVELLRGVPNAVRYDPIGFRTLTPLGEQELMGHYGGIVWLTHLDSLAVPFYQAYADNDGRTALCADLLMGIGETVGSGQRHTTAEEVERALADHSVDAESYRWYIEMRRSYPIQTSGFGLGIERFLCWVFGHNDVRDFQIVPRRNGVAIVP